MLCAPDQYSHKKGSRDGPDDSLSLVSLNWILTESALNGGLRYRDEAL
jgi:hypothetical protein